jgi:hydrogenase nickel incorporation protein HypA/HybF
MHEMGIAMQIAEIASAAVPPEMQGLGVKQVNLRVGKLAAVVPDSLRFCFEIITRDTVLAGAGLQIEEIPVKALCQDCNAEWFIEGPVFRCEKCDSGSIRILSGRELEISSIEIND